MRAFVVIGLGYGDEGKGSIVDWLTREFDASLVIRFNGGAQAAHHVVTPEGVEHTFHMFGSGTLAGADTYLSQHMMVNPQVLATEAAALVDLGIEEPFKRMWINEQASVTTPYHVALNRLKEMSRGDDRHGSCGLGIGETMEDRLSSNGMRWQDINDPVALRRCLHGIRISKLAAAHRLQEHYSMAWTREMNILLGQEDAAIRETFEIVARAVHTCAAPPLSLYTVICEGAQGILIDQLFGHAPYHTWSDCTPRNAGMVLGEIGPDETTILGVTRGYATRHGRGPLPTETTRPFVMHDRTNETNPWQGVLRYGWPDLWAMLYASNACRGYGGLDGIVVTCMDQILRDPIRVGWADTSCGDGVFTGPRRYHNEPLASLPKLLADAARLPLFAVSNGPTATSKKLLDNKLAVL